MDKSKDVYRVALELLSSDDSGEMQNLFEEIIEYEKNRPPDDPFDGAFEWYMIHGDARTLNKLVARRILNITFKTNKSCYYKPTDPSALEKALADFKSMTKVEHVPTEMPPDLLDVIVGHEEKKEIIKRSLNSDSPVHILLWGSVASAKSLIIEELSRLVNSKLILGSSLTKAGIYEVLFNEKPRYLLVDELDKIDDSENLTALLSLMERGRISETKYRRQRELKIKTWVFGTANRIDKLPPELKSRFLLLRFRDYTDDEFLEVVERVLTAREKIDSSMALRIGNEVLKHLNSKDVRDAVKICRLLRDKTIEEVSHIVDILRKQR